MKRPPRWSLHVLASGIVAILLVIGFPGGPMSVDLTRSYAQSPGEPIRAAITVGLVPWQYKDRSGKLTGFEVEMLRDVGRRMGREVEFIDTQWEGIFAGLQANKFDIVASAVSILCERQKIADFSVPYYDAGVSVTVRKADKRVQQVEDLKGMVTAAGGSGSTSHLWLLRHKLRYEMKEVRVYERTIEAMLDLEVSRIDAVAQNYPSAAYYVRDKPTLEVRLRNLTADKTGMAFRKGDPLTGQINTAIDAMKRDGTMARLHREQFGFDAPRDSALVRVVPPVAFSSDCR